MTKVLESKAGRINYYNTYLSTPEGLYNSDYESQFSTVSNGVGIYDGFSFPGLQSSDTVKSLSVRISLLKHMTTTNPSTLGFRLVTGYHNGKTTSGTYSNYTSISPELRYLVNNKSLSKQYEEYRFDLESDSEEVAWVNSNLSKVIGGTKFGIRIWGTTLRAKELWLMLTLAGGVQIFGGQNQGSEIYVGGTKANAVYLGSTKIL